MDTWTGPVTPQSSVIDEPKETPRRPLRGHPVMGRLDTILRELPEERQAAFMEMLQDEDDHEVTLDRRETSHDQTN